MDNSANHHGCQPDSCQPVRRGVVAVIVREGRFLVIRRSQTVIAPGMYCFPGGGIEGQETDATALVRELREELAVEIRANRLLWTCVTPWNVHLSWWLSEFVSTGELELIPNPAEVESVHWLTCEEMLALPDLLASNRCFLDAVSKKQIDLV